MPLSVLFDALRDQRRRYILYYLSDHDPTDIDAVTEQVCACEHDIPIEDTTDDRRESIKIDLYHNQLPRLSDAGIIDYDRRSGAIRVQYQPRIVTRILSIAKQYELQ